MSNTHVITLGTYILGSAILIYWGLYLLSNEIEKLRKSIEQSKEHTDG